MDSVKGNRWTLRFPLLFEHLPVLGPDLAHGTILCRLRGRGTGQGSPASAEHLPCCWGSHLGLAAPWSAAPFHLSMALELLQLRLRWETSHRTPDMPIRTIGLHWKQAGMTCTTRMCVIHCWSSLRHCQHTAVLSGSSNATKTQPTQKHT